MMCKLKGGMDKGEHYDMEIKKGGCKRGKMIHILKGRMDNGNYYVQIMRWM